MSTTTTTTGLSVFATSAGSLDMYRTNKPSRFSNFLKEPIQLNTNQKYEIALINYHLPAYEAILHGDDYEDSFIQYNIAQFHYDKTQCRYTPTERTVKRLFRLAPRTNLNGLWAADDVSGSGAFDFNSPLNNTDLDHTGVPALRARKEAFINRLASSLVLQKNAKHVVRGGGGDKKLNKEQKLFNVFRKELYDHPARESATVDEHLTLRMIEEEEDDDDDDDNKVKPSSAYETVVGATPAPVSLPLTESSGGSGGNFGRGGRVDELTADEDEEEEG